MPSNPLPPLLSLFWQVCGVVLRSLAELGMHIQEHAGERLYKCEVSYASDLFIFYLFYIQQPGGGVHGGRVVTLSPPTSEVGVRFPARPQVGKLVVACRWSGSLQCRTLTHQLCVLVSSTHKTTHHDMPCTVLKAT